MAIKNECGLRIECAATYYVADEGCALKRIGIELVHSIEYISKKDRYYLYIPGIYLR